MAATVLAATLLVGLSVAHPARAELGRDEMLGFLVQCLFTSEDGQPILPDRGRSPCWTSELQTVTSPARWRKHDHGGRAEPDTLAGGYQVSDSVLDPRPGRDAVIQTFDFGDGQRRFRRFDRGNGDGGDYLALVDGGVFGILTEDGGSGVQFFVGEGCRSGEPDGRLKSWLMFRDDVAARRWTETVARLNIARSADECPAGFASAYTRYLRDTIAVPFRVTDRDGKVGRRTTAIDTVVSEHFGGASVETAGALERFYFGQGVGKYRWEAWVNPKPAERDKIAGQAAALASSGRCAPLPYAVPPGDGYVMADCRMWTNLVWEPRPWAVRELGWPEVDPFGEAR